MPYRAARAVVRRIIVFLRFLVRRLEENRCDESAAWLSWVTLFALVPTLTVFYAILSMFPAFDQAGERISALAFGYLVPDAGAAVRDYVIAFTEQARQLRVAGSAMMVVSVGLMLRSIEDAFNRIWRVQRPRHGAVRFLAHGAIVLLAPLLAASAMLLGTYLGSLHLLDDTRAAGAGSLLLNLTPSLLGFAACTLLYLTVPNRPVRLLHAAIGGAAVSLCFFAGKELFTWAVAHATYGMVYGAFAALPLFLLWLNLSWLLLLLGAEFVHALGYHDFDPLQAGAEPVVLLPPADRSIPHE
jgi:membrane protein